MKFKLCVAEKNLKLVFFQKIFFLNFLKKLKIIFFKILIIFKKLSKYIKNDFLPK